MKKLCNSGAAALLTLCATFGVARADSTTSTSTTLPSSAVPTSVAVATVTPSTKLRLIPDAITDWVVFTGPSINKPTSMGTPDDSINNTQALSMEHYLGFKYKLSDSVSLVPTMDMLYNFTDPNRDGNTRGFSWGDAYLSLRKSALINTSLGSNKLTIDGWLNYYAPTSKIERVSNTIGSIAVWANPTLQFGKSRWSLSGYSYARQYMQTNSRPQISDISPGTFLIQSKFYAGPQINYEFNDKATGFLLYEAVARIYTNGYPDWVRNSQRSLTDLEPGMMINVSKSVMLMPCLNWYLNQPVSTTSVNLNASLKLL